MANLVLSQVTMPLSGDNNVVGDLASAPTKRAAVAGIVGGSAAAGPNSATFQFTGGSTGADTIPNAAFAAALPANSRLRALFDATYYDVPTMQAAFAAAGLDVGYPPGAAVSADLAFTNAAPGKPTATVTTTAANGIGFRLSMSHSITR